MWYNIFMDWDNVILEQIKLSFFVVDMCLTILSWLKVNVDPFLPINPTDCEQSEESEHLCAGSLLLQTGQNDSNMICEQFFCFYSPSQRQMIPVKSGLQALGSLMLVGWVWTVLLHRNSANELEMEKFACCWGHVNKKYTRLKEKNIVGKYCLVMQLPLPLWIM